MSQTPSGRGPCPYCRLTTPEARYAKREHVIPQSFGTFEQSLIAWNVCDSCNEFFDRELDRVLARGTYEGFLRFRVGNKPVREYKHIGRAAKIRFEAKTGPWTGMHLHQRIADDGSVLMVEPAKQLGFAKTEGEQPTYYLVEDAPDRERCGKLFGDEVFVHTVGFESDAEIRSTLDSLGYPDFGELTKDYSILADKTTVRVEQVATADRLVFRAVTKIAVNYLDAAFPGLSRMAVFHRICEYVRYDRHPELRPVRPTFDKTISNEPEGKRFLGHVVTLRYDAERDEVRATVALYNQIRYDIVLAATGFHLHLPDGFMTKGNLFDTVNRVIHDLAHSSSRER